MCVRKYLAIDFCLTFFFYAEDTWERLDQISGKICTHLTFSCLQLLHFGNGHQV